jgi:hypothetical protein
VTFDVPKGNTIESIHEEEKGHKPDVKWRSQPCMLLVPVPPSEVVLGDENKRPKEAREPFELVSLEDSKNTVLFRGSVLSLPQEVGSSSGVASTQ